MQVDVLSVPALVAVRRFLGPLEGVGWDYAGSVWVRKFREESLVGIMPRSISILVGDSRHGILHPLLSWSQPVVQLLRLVYCLLS